MKLPDFTSDPGLCALRKAMGADELGEFSTRYRPNALTVEELERLGQEGIDVAFEEIVRLKDGTLGYKDSRVLVYIRDVARYGGQFELPKFHVAYCDTLEKMRERNRFERYVVATREDGTFKINKIDPGKRISSSWERLNVCKNCLNKLSFDGFSYSLSQTAKNAVVQRFTISRFFELYPKSLHIRRPQHDYSAAPVNDYDPDFEQIATQLKSRRAWKCDRCHLDLSHIRERQFLHVHHKNGLKSDNRLENLEALCLNCHSKEFQHAHMRRTQEFQEFSRRYRVD